MQALETDLTTPWLKDRGPIDYSQSDDGDLIGLRIVAWTILMKPYLVGFQIQVDRVMKSFRLDEGLV